MNTEQIIKALECCFVKNNCNGCFMLGHRDCLGIAGRDALALIKELQAQNENLLKENKYLRESLADERRHKEDMGERIVVPIDINEQELEKIVAPYVEKMTVDARTIQANTITEICFRFAVHFSTYTENATVRIKHLFRFLDDMKKEILEGKVY